MQEATVAENLLEVVRLRLGSEPEGTKAESITVRIGEFRGIDSELLNNAFDSLKANRPGAENCKLTIEMVEMETECGSCHTVYRPRPIQLYKCQCGADMGKLSKGLELQVTQCRIEGEQKEASA